MKRLFLLLCFTACFDLLAQFTLKGKITHIENNEPVIGAVIFLPDLRIGAITDADGNYIIKNLLKGTYTIEVKYVSHKTLLEKVIIEQDFTKDFIMENAAVSMDEVIVSGATQRTVIKESPIPILSMGSVQWMGSGSTNLVDAVSKLPGMSQIQTGPTLSKPVIRGLGFNRVITMHDGIRQEDNQWGEEHSLHIDEYSIDKYEIIRGAGSLMYGSDGLGGVISILSPRPAEEGTIKGNILTTYQTNSNLYGVSGMVTGNQKGFVWMGRVSHKSSDNYRNPYDGRVYGSNFNENLDVNGMVGLQKKWGYSRIYFARWNQQINIIDGRRDSLGQFTKRIAGPNNTVEAVTVPENELSTRHINPANSQDLENIKVSSNNFFNLGKSSLMMNIGYSQNHRREYGNVFTPGQPDLYFYLQTLFYDVRFNLPELKGFETTIGTNGMYQAMNNKGNETLYPNFNLLDNGVFIFSKKKINRLIISGGIRHDFRSLDIYKLYVDGNGKFQTSPNSTTTERFAGFDKLFSNFTGSIGAVYNLTEKLLVRANVARGFRAPSVPEISSNGEHAGTYRYEIGNINQQSEVSLQTDLGATYDGKDFYFDINFFRNYIANYSFSEKVLSSTGADTLINNVPIFHYKQGNAELLGTEATATLNPQQARWFSLTQSYSLVRGRNLSAQDSSKFLPFMPAPRWITRLRLTMDRYKGILRNSYFFVEFEYNQQQNQALFAYRTETVTPEYYLVNSGIGTDVTGKAKNVLFSVYITMNNIFDAAYQSHQSRLKYLDVNQVTGRQGVFNMGRNLSIRILIPIDIKKSNN